MHNCFEEEFDSPNVLFSIFSDRVKGFQSAAVQTHRAVPAAEPRLSGMLLSTSMMCLDPTEMLSSSAMCLTCRVVKCMDLPPGNLGIEISNVSETSKYLNLMSLKIKLPSCRA